MKGIKRFINEWNMMLVVIGFLMACVAFQLWYTLKLKAELRLFREQEHIVIEKVMVGKDVVTSDTLRIKHNNINHKIN
jgi:hypothetical protein